jgi:ATP-dependent helicase/DNAse subunit B
VSKEIWLGPVLGTNRERLLARCAEYVSKGQLDRLLYLAASHSLLDLVTERLLDGGNVRGVWDEFPVYLFRGFVRRVLSSALVSEARLSGTFDAESCESLPPRLAIDREDLPVRRTLISQIIKQLGSAGKLKAIRPLAHRDGCVNTVASLIGELQRAGKTPEEFQSIIELRSQDFHANNQRPNVKGQSSQLDFDREVALIYAAYSASLDRFGLTDEDADQLRALQVLRGVLDGRKVYLPWLSRIDLLVLDGFFDFTPVQGEMLRWLIPSVPNVIVNLNGDERNQEIFRPFHSTIEHLMAIDRFDVRYGNDMVVMGGAVSSLRERLFNSDGGGAGAGRMPAIRPQDAGAPVGGAPVFLFECSDREVEIRSIAKEIKSLVLREGYKLSDIAVVVRERSAYAETILRVCADESIPCNLERRVEAQQIPAVRACGKLFQLLKETSREDFKNPRASDLAHLIKTGYFSLSKEDLTVLVELFDKQFGALLLDKSGTERFQSFDAAQRQEHLRASLRIGEWAPDMIENVIAYVGSELRVSAWLDRARRLIDLFPSPEAAKSLIADIEDHEETTVATPDEAAEEIAKRKRPVPVHPAAIAWTSVVLGHLQKLVADLPAESDPEELRGALMMLFEHLDFSNQVRRPFQKSNPSDIPQAIVDVRGLESLRRAMAAAVRSFKLAGEVVSEARPRGPQPGSPAGVGRSGRATKPLLTRGLLAPVALSAFIDEVERSLNSQSLLISNASRDGLRVLEATDVRGLRFRAVFIAGMIEGGFPLRASRDWLYPHEERERLKKYGVILEDISTDTLLKEEHYFYQAACRATDRLYLTRPLTTDDGNETVASYYLEELQRAIAPVEITKVQVRSDVDTRDIEHISTASELALVLVRQDERHRHHANRPALLPKTQVAALLAAAKLRGYISPAALRRVEIERERNGGRFGRFDGEITNEALRSMLAQHFGTDYVHSASALSTYGNCAYRFFAGRVLRLEPRSEAALDLQAIDAGKLLHDILRRFFEQHRKQYLPGQDREGLRRQLADVADQVFDEHERLVPPLNRRIWEIDCEIRKLILDQVLLYELRLQEKTRERGIVPVYFELAFGRASQASDPKSSPDFLKIERFDGHGTETALLQGQIDRVDIDEREHVAIAYDYKLSQGAKLEDIEAGRQIQIPIYLAALEQMFLPGYKLAGGGYYRLRGAGPRLNQGLYRAALADYTSVTSTKTKLDDIEWQRIRREVRRKVWEFIDGMRMGHFPVQPSLGKITCKFCDYAAVCRYDTYRISRKLKG